MDVINDTVEKLVNYHLNNGMSGFYVGGNTGECTVLPNKTRKQMLEAVVAANKKRGTIIAHVGAGHLDDVYELIDHANTLEIDAIASLPPSLQSYYNMEEIIEYYRMIANRSKHPVFAYITSVLQDDIIKFAEELSKIDNIIGLKISVPNYYLFGNIKKRFEKRFIIFNGPDETMICGLSEGADGAIGTSYNIFPKLALSIYDNFQKGKNDEALKAQRRLNDFIDILINENIAWWKATLSILLGFDVGYTVAPQKMPNTNDLRVLKEKLEALNCQEIL